MNFSYLLVNLGLAVANLGAKYEPTGVAQKLLDAYAKRREQAQLREELDALIAARFDKFREQLADAMSDDRLQLADGVRAQVEAYLSQLQASAKQAARVLGDPSATTVPATVNINSAAELAAFLPQRPPRFTVGDTVPGLPSWMLTEPLGSGGFGEVWKAENPDDDVPVAAFKFFLDPDARTRFTRAEAAALREIHRQAPHDGVVKLRQAESLADPPWLQFEYIGGGDLSRLPEEWKALPNASRVKRVQAAIRTLAATAGKFHKLGVVHRDLKPSNVLLRKTADGHTLVIADFGISKIVRPAGQVHTPSGASLVTIRAYTPVYASPQQKRGLPADVRDDVYSLGVLWYQLLRGDFTLERPGGDGWKEDLRSLGVSPADVALLNRCWDDTAERRPADGSELAQRLTEARPRAEPVSRPASTSGGGKSRQEQRIVSPRQLPAWGIYAAVCIALCALAGLTIGGYLIVMAQKEPDTATQVSSPREEASPQSAPKRSSEVVTLNDLQGTWMVVTKTGGKGPPLKEGEKRAMIIEGDKFYDSTNDRKLEIGIISLSPDKQPAEFDITPKQGENADPKIIGIYKCDGNTLTFCVEMESSKNTIAPRPTEFKADEVYSLLVLKKVSDKK